jgi:hypothetical protein
MIQIVGSLAMGIFSAALFWATVTISAQRKP